MPQQPFTSDGVQQKLNELYALPDDALLSEATSIRQDFRSWLLANFSFNDMQRSYMADMDLRFFNATACETASAIENRLPVQVEMPPEYPDIEPASKLIEARSSIVYSYTLDGFTAEGALTFRFINKAE